MITLKCTLLIALLTPALGTGESLTLDFRAVAHGDAFLRCVATNETETLLSIPYEFFNNGNRLTYLSLSDKNRTIGILGWIQCGYGEWPQTPISPGEHWHHVVFCETFLSRLKARGDYCQLDWRVLNMPKNKLTTSNPIIIANAMEDGTVTTPVVGAADTNFYLRLGMVFLDQGKRDLSFLGFNGSPKDCELPIGSSDRNRLRFSSGPLGYTNVLALAFFDEEAVSVCSHAVIERRIPLERAFSMLSPDDFEKLRDHGELDLQWVCGEWASAVLPLWLHEERELIPDWKEEDMLKLISCEAMEQWRERGELENIAQLFILQGSLPSIGTKVKNSAQTISTTAGRADSNSLENSSCDESEQSR